MDGAAEFLLWFDEVIRGHDDQRRIGLHSLDERRTEADAGGGVAAARLANHLLLGNHAAQLLCGLGAMLGARQDPRPLGRHLRRNAVNGSLKEGSIAAHFGANVVEIRPSDVVLDTGVTLPCESVLLLTGYRADPEFMRRIGVTINDETLEPRYSAETYETNVPGLFVAGGQLAGKKTGTVFIENGRFHGEVIARTLAARLGQAG